VNLHSRTLESDATVCGDLATIYNSLVADELAPSAPECRVLVVTPRYDGALEANVNATIEDLEQVSPDELRAAQVSGRHVAWQVIRPRAPEDLKAALCQRLSLLIYIGHAAEGMLCLPAGDLSPSDFPAESLLGVTSVLVGCDTKGASNLSRSVASKMLSVGARAVFSTSFTLPLMMGQHLTRSLLTSLLRENLSMGDAIAGVRVWMLHNFWIHALGSDLGISTRKNVAFVLPEMHRSFHQDLWLKTWTALRSEIINRWPDARKSEFLQAVLTAAAAAGLSLTFAGDIRSKLFEY
jgi:hypothetical protein